MVASDCVSACLQGCCKGEGRRGPGSGPRGVCSVLLCEVKLRKFIFGASSPDSDCSHEIKRRLLLGRKVMTNLDSILKSRDITLPEKST